MIQKSLRLTMLFLLVPFFLGFCPGCARFGQQGIQAKVSLADIRVVEIRAVETAFLVELRVLNPNETTFQVQGVECDLRIDGKHFASGVSGGQYEIPAYGSAIIPVDVYASVLDVLPSVISIVQGRSAQEQKDTPLAYELSGHIRVDGDNVFRKSLPFQTKGELSFAGIR